MSSVIIGAKTVEQLQGNIAATRIELSGEELAGLNEVSRLPAEYLAWMIELQGKYREA